MPHRLVQPIIIIIIDNCGLRKGRRHHVNEIIIFNLHFSYFAIITCWKQLLNWNTMPSKWSFHQLEYLKRKSQNHKSIKIVNIFCRCDWSFVSVGSDNKFNNINWRPYSQRIHCNCLVQFDIGFDLRCFSVPVHSRETK